MKKIVIALLALLCAQAVFADNVGYIIKNTANYQQRIVDIVEDMGFTVDVIDDSALPSTDFSPYTFIVVGTANLDNPEYIPVNTLKSLILNSDNLDDFNWSEYGGVRISGGHLEGFVNDPNHFITKDIASPVVEYTITGLTDTYLPKTKKAVRLRTILSNPSDHSDAVIATADVGTILRNNYVSKAKGVFYGITEDEYWTPASEILFRRCILWLLTDFAPPAILNITVDQITNESARITWTTDKPSSGNVTYTGPNGGIVQNSTIALQHMVKLAGLASLSTYNFRINACNVNGYCNESTVRTFTTLDLTAPQLVSHEVTSITNQSAVFSITLNEQGTIKVYYGQAQLTSVVEGNTPAMLFNLPVSNLQEKTTYSYKVNMCDIYNNCANSSVYSFSTIDLTPPGKPNNLMLEVLAPSTNIKVKWQASPSSDVAYYNIYASSTGIFDFALLGTSPSLEYIDSSAGITKKRYYIVRARDLSGNEEQNNEMVEKYDLDLKIGYNAVSLPIVPFDKSISAVMHQSASYKPIAEVQWYDNGMQVSQFTSGWSAQTQMDLLEGFFFLSNQDNLKFTVVGYPAAQGTIQLRQGMNLAGLSLGNDVVADAKYSGIDEISSRKGDGQFAIATDYGDWHFSEPFDLRIERAYWIKVSHDMTVEVAP